MLVLQAAQLAICHPVESSAARLIQLQNHTSLKIMR